MNDTAPTREQIAAEMAAAREAESAAADRARAAQALAEVTAKPGLWYRPVGDDEQEYVVGCDGRALGRMWRGADGTLLHGWTCAPFGATERLGPHRTARACAAALATACGVTPTHEMTT